MLVMWLLLSFFQLAMDTDGNNFDKRDSGLIPKVKNQFLSAIWYEYPSWKYEEKSNAGPIANEYSFDSCF